MGLLNSLASKILGLPSVADLANKDLGAFLRGNGISQEELAMYRINKSSTDPRFFERVYVGTGVRSGNTVGVLSYYNEHIGTLDGVLIDPELAKSFANDKSGTENQYRSDDSPFDEGLYGFLRYKAGDSVVELIPLHELR